MIVVVLIILLVLVTLFTSIQTMYLEGMRLRTRDIASLQYFKSELEPRLNLRSEEGALTFSLGATERQPPVFAAAQYTYRGNQMSAAGFP